MTSIVNSIIYRCAHVRIIHRSHCTGCIHHLDLEQWSQQLHWRNEYGHPSCRWSSCSSFGRQPALVALSDCRDSAFARYSESDPRQLEKHSKPFALHQLSIYGFFGCLESCTSVYAMVDGIERDGDSGRYFCHVAGVRSVQISIVNILIPILHINILLHIVAVFAQKNWTRTKS